MWAEFMRTSATKVNTINVNGIAMPIENVPFFISLPPVRHPGHAQGMPEKSLRRPLLNAPQKKPFQAENADFSESSSSNDLAHLKNPRVKWNQQEPSEENPIYHFARGGIE